MNLLACEMIRVDTDAQNIIFDYPKFKTNLFRIYNSSTMIQIKQHV